MLHVLREPPGAGYSQELLARLWVTTVEDGADLSFIPLRNWGNRLYWPPKLEALTRVREMLITICKSKIHRATITDKDLNYVGSITIDRDLMDMADLVRWEQVQIANINTGARFETYVIEGERGSGTIALNGAAARLAEKGDLVIIIAYAQIDRHEAEHFKPAVVHVDSHNKPIK